MIMSKFYEKVKTLIPKITQLPINCLINELMNSSNYLRSTQRQFSENICSEDELRSRIFGTFVVNFLACLPLLGFANIYKIVKLPIFNGF